MERPKLQVALDLQDLPSALGPLQKAAPHLDVIECGTILCLAEGMHAVRIIRSLFPDKPVLADVRIVGGRQPDLQDGVRRRRKLGVRRQRCDPQHRRSRDERGGEASRRRGADRADRRLDVGAGGCMA